MCCGVSGCSGAFVAKKIWRFSPCGGRLRQELAVFQGVGALSAGLIYLIGVNKSGERGRAHSPGGAAPALRAGRSRWVTAGRPGVGVMLNL